jgi:hypothetical protein
MGERDPEEEEYWEDIRTAISEFSLGRTFRDALRWDLIDNRPNLRCLHGKA